MDFLKALLQPWCCSMPFGVWVSRCLWSKTAFFVCSVRDFFQLLWFQLTIWLLACFCNLFLFIFILVWFFPGLFLFASKSTVSLSSWKNPPTAGLQHQLSAKVGNPPHAITRLAFRYEGVLVGTLGIISFLSAGLGTEWVVVGCRLVWRMLDVGHLDGNTMDESRYKFYKKCQCRKLLMPKKNGFHVLWCRIGTLSHVGYGSKILDSLPITDVLEYVSLMLAIFPPKKSSFRWLPTFTANRLDGVGLLYLTHHR